jgi:hypothetical protein
MNDPMKGPSTKEEGTPSNLGLACNQTDVRWVRGWCWGIFLTKEGLMNPAPAPPNS